MHAVVPYRVYNLSIYTLCNEYYSISLRKQCYNKTIYPFNDWQTWIVLPHIMERIVLPLEIRCIAGQPISQRILSRGEQHASRKCSKCGIHSHNQHTYSNASPCSTNGATKNPIA